MIKIFNIEDMGEHDDEDMSDLSMSTLTFTLRAISSEMHDLNEDVLSKRHTLNKIPTTNQRQRFVKAVKHIIEVMRIIKKEQTAQRDGFVREYTASISEFELKNIENQSNYSGGSANIDIYPRQTLVFPIDTNVGRQKSDGSDNLKDSIYKSDTQFRKRTLSMAQTENLNESSDNEAYPIPMAEYNPLVFPKTIGNWIMYIVIFPLNILYFYLFPNTLQKPNDKKIIMNTILIFLCMAGLSALILWIEGSLVSRYSVKPYLLAYANGLGLIGRYMIYDEGISVNCSRTTKTLCRPIRKAT